MGLGYLRRVAVLVVSWFDSVARSSRSRWRRGGAPAGPRPRNGRRSPDSKPVRSCPHFYAATCTRSHPIPRRLTPCERNPTSQTGRCHRLCSGWAEAAVRRPPPRASTASTKPPRSSARSRSAHGRRRPYRSPSTSTIERAAHYLLAGAGGEARRQHRLAD